MEALDGHSSGNLDMESLLDNIKGIESPFFLFRPLTKLPHPNTIKLRKDKRKVGEANNVFYR